MGKKNRNRMQTRAPARPQQQRPQSIQTPATIPTVPGPLVAVGSLYGRLLPASLHSARWNSRTRLILALFLAIFLVLFIAAIYAIASGGFGAGIGWGIVGLLIGLLLAVLVGLIPLLYVFRGVMAIERREYDRFAFTRPQRNLPVRISLGLQRLANRTLEKRGVPNARLSPRTSTKRPR